jgi:hypothetical protein
MHQALVDGSRECEGKFWSEREYNDKACGQCSVRRAAWGGCTTAEKYVCRELEFVMAGLLTGVEVQAAAEGACESILVAAATVEAKRVVVELWGAAERLAEEEEAEEVQAALLQELVHQIAGVEVGAAAAAEALLHAVAGEEVAAVVREEVGAVVLAAELLEEVVREEVEAAVRYGLGWIGAG